MHLTRRCFWTIWWTVAALLLCGALLWALAAPRQTAPEAVIVLKRPFAPPVRLRDRIESLIPPKKSWGWAHNLIDSVFGRRKTLNLDAEVFAFQSAFATEKLELPLRPASFSAQGQGIKVWFLAPDELSPLRLRLENQPHSTGYRSRVSTADGIGAGLFMGNSVVLHGITNQVGIQEDYFARINAGGVDLFTSLFVSQTATNDSNRSQLDVPEVCIRTNADFSVRLQVPNRHSCFVVKRDPVSGDNTGFLLEFR